MNYVLKFLIELRNITIMYCTQKVYTCLSDLKALLLS